MSGPVLAFAILILVLGARAVAVARPLINQWGATDQEHQATWPGDQLVARPSVIWTNAITIHAPAAHVWPWLVQHGQGHGGVYSYDWLEDFIGCDVHSTDRILPGLQTPLRVGERVIRTARYAPYAPVALFAPPHALVLGHVKDTHAELAAGHARSTWAFILQPVDQDSTRLLVRCRGNSLLARLQGPVQFVMQHKMMLGLKQRAEGSLPSPSTIDGNQPQPGQSPERRDLALAGYARTPGRQRRGGHGRSELADAVRCLGTPVPTGGLGSQRRAVLAPTRRGGLVCPAERAHL